MKWQELIMVDDEIRTGSAVIQGACLAVDVDLDLPDQGWSDRVGSV